MDQLIRVWDGNKELSPEALPWNIFRRMMQYGDGFFESLRLHHSTLLCTTFHSERIARTARALYFPQSLYENTSPWMDRLYAMLKSFPYHDARIRMIFGRKDDGNRLPISEDFIMCIEITAIPEETYFPEKGYHVFTETEKDHFPGRLSSFKTLNYLEKILPMYRHREKHADEILLCNPAGRIAEGTHSNIFLIKEGTWTTPPLEEGCLDGVMRKTVLEFCRENQIPFQPVPVTLEDLFNADTLFCTTAFRGIIPVASLNGKSINTSPVHLWQPKVKEYILKNCFH